MTTQNTDAGPQVAQKHYLLDVSWKKSQQVLWNANAQVFGNCREYKGSRGGTALYAWRRFEREYTLNNPLSSALTSKPSWKQNSSSSARGTLGISSVSADGCA